MFYLSFYLTLDSVSFYLTFYLSFRLPREVMESTSFETLKIHLDIFWEICSRWLCLSRALYQLISRIPFQTQPLCVSASGSHIWSGKDYLCFYSLDIFKLLYPNLTIDIFLNLLSFSSFVTWSIHLTFFWSSQIFNKKHTGLPQ